MYDFTKLETFIGLNKPAHFEPTLENLNHYIRQYVLHVPFENINVQNRLPLAVNNASMIQKITERHQGGICYENNRLTYEYLSQHGYDMHFIAATVNQGEEKGWAAENVHMTTIATLNGSRYLVETGFGESPLMAVPLNGDIVEDTAKRQVYKIKYIDDTTFDLLKKVKDQWVIQYRAVDHYLKFRDFENAMVYNQTSLDSHFVTDPLLVKNWETGHVTMTGRNLTVTDQGKKEKHPVTRENYRQFLADYFNITHTPILFFEPEETE
ncbi:MULTISPECIES: arylamine N-acetyltransferase family protein [Staphylococcus]|nr:MULTISPECIES: arylamine N-acetyltransferase [Staphylococcus]QPA24443.1 arylamine N-acetyltransferase [Mammaliicoccus fleurettii]EPD49343.1 hypothetical protein HMPREF1208_01691 [Staphylococcus sp. HGB0015]MBF1993596.1 arylamine N-acetyltransferase [Staphylococcus schleiferi]MBF2039170.1 arylamine N-acetyltransferase [Staphylococcus schleiferi]MBF2101158.1 arylamine N-acetyltransferase [Staphylococcus schleiferi]